MVRTNSCAPRCRVSGVVSTKRARTCPYRERMVAKRARMGPFAPERTPSVPAAFAHALHCAKIARVTLTPMPPRPGSRRRDALLLALAVVCLTLLFTAQDAMRRGANGGAVVWSQELAINALDWVVWGALVPAIVLVGRRIRLDGTGNRAARVAGWLALAVAFCAVQGVATGLIIRLTDPAFFGLFPP